MSVCAWRFSAGGFVGPGELSVTVAQKRKNAKNTNKLLVYRATATAQEA